ncbi:MAG: hypothetical protein IKW42_06015 [Alistipes sp.]|nr:hypothetical protein [Alistipes sp.]
MKRFLYSVAIISAMLFAAVISSCSKEETKSFVVPAEGILVAKPGDSGTTSFDSSNITSISATSTPAGWIIDEIDMYNGTITVTAPSSFDNGEVESGTITLTGYTPTGNTKSLSIYVAIVSNEVNYFNAPANCYVATQHTTRYILDPTMGGRFATADVKLLWETKENLILYLDMRDGKVTFYLDEVEEDDEPMNKVHHGNALIGGYDESGELLWSWHIWVTNNDPMAAENTVTIGGTTMMNINLGAELNSNGSKDGAEVYKSYGMYYQWGRKDPFVGPQNYDFPGNNDDVMYYDGGKYTYLEYVESADVDATIEYASASPMSLIKGNKDNAYDWLCEGHNDNLWSSTTKSVNDPCPAGWRLPDASLFANLTIDASYDEMAWAELQPIYGLKIIDSKTAAEYFFTAQGRRNYLDCRLDIINDDPTRPVPWSGYYWTTTPAADGNAKALYFDLNTATRTWNGFEAARDMHRANAMPVRCVKE